MASMRYDSDEESEIDNDLLVVAKFAQLDVQQDEFLPNQHVADPSEIALSDGEEDDANGRPRSESSSSSSSSDVEIIQSKNQKEVVDHEEDDAGSLDDSDDEETKPPM